jgi:hypothetical protein
VLRLQRFWYVVSFGIFYSFLLMLRLRGSIFRLPADPGYSIFEGVRRGSFSNLLSLDADYFNFLERFVALFVVVFPIEFTALASSLITSLVWISTAVAITAIAKRVTNSSILAIMAGLMVVLVPAASESSIGNIGNIKWQMFIALTVTGSSTHLLATKKYFVWALTLITGFTHPLALIGAIPLLARSFSVDKSVVRTSRIAFGLATASFICQFLVHQQSGAGLVRGQITYWWSGIPIFWLFNLVFPLTLCGGVAVTAIVLRKFASDRFPSSFLIALAGLLTGLVSYAQAGIADRYFVAPTVLGWVALLLLFSDVRARFPKLSLVVLIPIILVLSLGAFKWFGPSSYIDSGPTWSSEVERGRIECLNTGAATIDLQMPVGTTEVPCSDLED